MAEQLEPDREPDGGFEQDRKIAKAAAGPERELVVLVPRGSGKTTLMAAIGVWHEAEPDLLAEGQELHVVA